MSKNKKIVVLSLLICIFLTIIPFVVSSGADFNGTDAAAGTVIQKLKPEYKPWAAPIAERILGRALPKETETLLFCLQAAIGSGVLCFGFGYLVARKKYSKEGGQEQDEESSPTWK